MEMNKKTPQCIKAGVEMLSEAYNVKENSRLGCQIHITEDLEGLEVELAPYE